MDYLKSMLVISGENVADQAATCCKTSDFTLNASARAPNLHSSFNSFNLIKGISLLEIMAQQFQHEQMQLLKMLNSECIKK